MDKFTSLLSEQFGAELADQFQKKAYYYQAMDYLEYMSRDTTIVSDRVDSFLTVLWDADEHEIVGFRLKGFRYAFETYIRRAYKLKKEDFNPLVGALIAYFTNVGNCLFEEVPEDDEHRVEAYAATMDFVEKEQVTLPEDFKNVA